MSHLPRRFIIATAALLLIVGIVPKSQVGLAQSGSYPIVDTGQTGCYSANGTLMTCPAVGDAVYGQDAQVSGNAPSYTNNGDGTVTDNVTGLIWQKSPDTNGDGTINVADKLSYANASAYCQNLSLAGATDWQLPDIKQLYSLINFNGTDPVGLERTDTTGLIPFIDTAYFDFAYGDVAAGERIIDVQYASSTLYVSNTANDGGSTLFGVNFADGRIKGYGLSIRGSDKTFSVICVRGNTDYGQNDFVDHGDNTITDQATGLMWAQQDSAVALDWAEALAWVETQNAANYLGHSDWRLPNAKELQSLVDYSRSPDTTASAAINALFHATSIVNEAGGADFPSYWTSTTHIKDESGSIPGEASVYIAFGRAMGYSSLSSSWVDVHDAGAQRSDPKVGNASDYPRGNGPQGDAVRIDNYVRLVRGGDATEAPVWSNQVYLPVSMR